MTRKSDSDFDDDFLNGLKEKTEKLGVAILDSSAYPSTSELALELIVNLLWYIIFILVWGNQYNTPKFKNFYNSIRKGAEK